MKINYFEKIEQSIDYIERNIKNENLYEEVIRKSFYSYPQFYRIFKDIVGDSIKFYIQKRRLSSAAEDLIKTEDKIINISLNYGYDSQQTFTRAFKTFFEMSPLKYREYGMLNNLYNPFYIPKKLNEELKLMIEVENLPSFIIASYYAYENDIEHKNKNNLQEKVVAVAWSKLVRWQMIFEYQRVNGILKKVPKTFQLANFMIDNGLHLKNNTRYFGFTNPYPHDENEYGYEAWCTINNIDEKAENFDDKSTIQIRKSEGGLYATAYASYGNDSNLDFVWKQLHYWLAKNNSYEYGEHQWLEEHFTKEGIGGFHGFKLYLPIKLIKK